MNHKCELCGGDVQVEGHTTRHYEPVEKSVEERAVKLVDSLYTDDDDYPSATARVLAYRDEVLEEAITELPVSPATRRVSAQLIRALKGAK